MTLLGCIKPYLSWRGLKYIIKCLLLCYLPLTVLLYLQWQLKARPGSVPRKMEYGKATKTADNVKHLCSQENQAHKCQLTELLSATTLMNWSKNSRQEEYYINVEGPCELSFSTQQWKAKNFTKHCCNVMFPHIQQQLTNKMIDDLRRSHQKTIIDLHGEHQHVIPDRD